MNLFFVLQVASGSLGEPGRNLWNYCMLRIGGVVLLYRCVEPFGGALEFHLCLTVRH